MKKVKLKLELQYNSPVILTFFLLSLLVLFPTSGRTGGAPCTCSVSTAPR